jgi:hypothetical protein
LATPKVVGGWTVRPSETLLAAPWSDGTIGFLFANGEIRMKRLSRVMGTAAMVALGVSAMTSQPASAGNDAILGAVGGLMAGKLISDHQQKVREDSYRQGAEEQYIAPTTAAVRCSAAACGRVARGPFAETQVAEGSGADH